MLTNGQKRAIHSAARQAGIDSCKDEEQYRMILLNVGGFRSAADRTASRQGYIAVMAFFEEASGGQLRGCTPGYWAAENAKANPRDPIIYKIRQTAESLGMDAKTLDHFIASRHMSSGWYESLEDAPTRWLVKVLEGLKAMDFRKHGSKETDHDRPVQQNQQYRQCRFPGFAKQARSEPAGTRSSVQAMQPKEVPF